VTDAQALPSVLQMHTHNPTPAADAQKTRLLLLITKTDPSQCEQHQSQQGWQFELHPAAMVTQL
jgi:hypothetical protein